MKISKLARFVVFSQLIFCLSASSQGVQGLIPPDFDYLLDSWSFNDTTWASDLGDTPLSFTNLNNLSGVDGNALQVDSTNAAWLQYSIADDTVTNLTFPKGTIELWVLPDWNSGTGPGEWGRLIDVGAYSTNSPSSWWSLYFSPDGNNINFSFETNGVFTNVLSYPISWDTNTWHLIDLAYAPFRTELFIDGQLATNTGGFLFMPNAEVVTNGFFVGSDATGTQQSRVLIDDLATYTYPLSEYEASNDYKAVMGSTGGGGFSPDDGVTPLGGEPVTNTLPGNMPTPDYGSNLWVALLGTTNATLSLLESNTISDVLYELQGCTNLMSPNWVSYGFVSGSEITNCTPTIVPINKHGNLFLRIRSWQDSTGTEIPDWWWYSYFGEITNVNAYASAAGDGFNNLQKWQMGLNPTNYYNPNGPTNFVAYQSGSNIFLYWSPSAGPVVNYAIQRGIHNTNTGNYTFTQFLVSSNATNFEDINVITNSNALLNEYTLSAVYSGGSYSGTDTWFVSWGNLLPAPTNLQAYADSTGTNVWLTWSPVSNSLLTGYIIERGTFDASIYYYHFVTNAIVTNNVTSFEDVGILSNSTNWGDVYQIAALYPGGGMSAFANQFEDFPYVSIQPGSPSGPAGPSNFYGYGTYVEYPYANTNVYLNWTAASGSVSNYIIYAASNSVLGNPLYHMLGKVGSGTTTFTVMGGMDWIGNLQYSTFALVAVYTNGSQSRAVFWNWLGAASGPDPFYAFVDSTGTNIVLSWGAVPNATGYLVEDLFNDPIATTGASTLNYTDSVTIAELEPYDIDPSNVWYQVQAIFPDGNYSAPATAQVTDTPPSAPPPSYPPATNLTVTVTGTNVSLNWTAAPGVVSNYVIERGTYNQETGTYTYSQIATTSGTSYEDVGAIANPNNYHVSYEVLADYGGGHMSTADLYSTMFGGAVSPNSNISTAAQLVRNQAGRWQLMFSTIPTNVDTIALYWYAWDYWYDLGGPFWLTSEIDIPANTLINGIYSVPDWQTMDFIGDTFSGQYAVVQSVKGGEYGNASFAGFLPADEPSYVDGRIPLKQNLLFELRAATVNHPVALSVNDFYFGGNILTPVAIPTGSNCVESSIFHWEDMDKGYNQGFAIFTRMDDLWPYIANYELHGLLYDTNYSGPSSFVWQTNLDVIPASPVLGNGDPYFIFHDFGNFPDVGAYTNSGTLYFQNGYTNLFGLPFETALVNNGGITFIGINPSTGLPLTVQDPITYLSPGSSIIFTNANCWYGQTADPVLVLTNYYFAQVATPGTELPSENTPLQPAPIPTLVGFDNTNRTRTMITSVGNPTVVGGWARFAIANGNPSKFAYLGQYYETNAFIITNGMVTTNTAGVVSPYGDFFPTQGGQFALVTMPDIDTGQQGTCAVDVVSLNVDANHDGTMDYSFKGPDFVSANDPYRFWVNDDQDSGDYGGEGIPLTNSPFADGISPSTVDDNGNPLYTIHGSRDLVDFFPVYINIGGLFQSNAWRAGINYADTNWQFVLSQADSALRFTYTDLTPTNYMNYLRDLTTVSNLVNIHPFTYPFLTTISNTGVTLENSFVANIATNNGGIILVEAWEPTTQPLELTIYHGTNQVAQADLSLSINEVEQMFRSKTILLNSNSMAVPDRLTDEDVPNEPPTNDKNFVFVHGYNVNPDQARGWNADYFKRLYWSGSHAKFYGVTWEGADSQKAGAVTINLQSNIVNAFDTAPLLNSFLNNLSGTNVVAAHSLGNIVVLSTLSDCTNRSINTYFMVDAALAIEAIDPAAGSNPDMYPSTWTNYNGNLWASDWYGLFPTNDYRSKLTWSGRLTNFQNAAVFNFYSSGEEVLRDYPSDPPDNLPGIAIGQLVSLWKGDSGEYTWVWQEKLKGLMLANGLLSSDHGGWQLNTAYETNIDTDGNFYWQPMSPVAAAQLTTAQLQTNAFFNFGSPLGSLFSFTNDLALESSGGSSYAQANRNRILSDAIPCLSLPIGANPVPSLSPPYAPSEMNFDMQTLYENGWPRGRGSAQYPFGTTAAGEWHHSDNRAVAYTFTYQFFNKMVTIGNLK